MDGMDDDSKGGDKLSDKKARDWLARVNQVSKSVWEDQSVMGFAFADPPAKKDTAEIRYFQSLEMALNI